MQGIIFICVAISVCVCARMRRVASPPAPALVSVPSPSDVILLAEMSFLHTVALNPSRMPLLKSDIIKLGFIRLVCVYRARRVVLFYVDIHAFARFLPALHATFLFIYVR